MVEWQDVLLEWIRHESETRPDFRKMLKKRDFELIKNPDLKNRKQSSELLKILSAYRTYLSRDYFVKRKWSVRTFDKNSLEKLLLPLGTGWKYISGGSHKAADAAETIFDKPDAIGKRYASSIKFITDNYRKISESKHKLIIVEGDRGKMQIVEGAHRLVAIFYRKLKEPSFRIKPIEAYVGKGGPSKSKKSQKQIR
ncbi:MAG: hypothetical protein KGH65_05405 [Candidatus Micrarchaeota archaeon]|nr:hypothetical protein [Candidatus Micrarchaeota archaeon]